MRFELEWVKELRPCGPEGNENARMIGHVRILGADFHVNAEQVHYPTSSLATLDGTPVGEVTEQATVIDEDQTFAPEIWQITDGAAETVTIDGRQYLLVISPFQE